jgi:hypothetical protein
MTDKTSSPRSLSRLQVYGVLLTVFLLVSGWLVYTAIDVIPNYPNAIESPPDPYKRGQAAARDALRFGEASIYVDDEHFVVRSERIGDQYFRVSWNVDQATGLPAKSFEADAFLGFGTRFPRGYNKVIEEHIAAHGLPECSVKLAIITPAEFLAKRDEQTWKSIAKQPGPAARGIELIAHVHIEPSPSGLSLNKQIDLDDGTMAVCELTEVPCTILRVQGQWEMYYAVAQKNGLLIWYATLE